jgi:alpha,alpha-trehalose phosphorylase
VHVASTGGVWTALVCGFGGMRDHLGELSFDPRLPADWPELQFTLTWQGSPLDVTIRRDELRALVRSGEPVPFTVRGESHVAVAGEAVIVPLADQGPVLSGHPSMSMHSKMRREDGTMLEPTLPPITTAIPIIADDLTELSSEAHHIEID